MVMKAWGADGWMKVPSSVFSCFRLCVRLVCLPWFCFSSFVPSLPLYFLVFSFIPLFSLFFFSLRSASVLGSLPLWGLSLDFIKPEKVVCSCLQQWGTFREGSWSMICWLCFLSIRSSGGWGDDEQCALKTTPISLEMTIFNLTSELLTFNN